MAKLDPDLDSQVEFSGGEDEANTAEKREALGARHRRGYGYTSEGARENDQKIAATGHKPLRIAKHVHPVPESRIASFSHGMATHHISTVHKHAVHLHH